MKIRDLAFFVLDIAFLAAMTWLCSSTLIEKWQIEQREKTDGCVISSRDNVRVSHRKGRRREHHSYSCTFSYEVGGHRYTAHDSISGYVTPIGFELPRKGQPITVFYDSENPQSANVFNPEIHFLYWIGYIALFAGLWLFWPLRFQRKEMCGKSSDRCVEDSSGACKLWMGKYWRNANAPIWPCVLMIIVGLGFTWITLDTGLAYCKSSSIVGCICLALNFASNLAIYLALSCLMSKINPIQRRHRFLAVSGAIISCIILFILWSVFRAAWKDIFGIRGKSLLWPLLFYIEGCRGLWRLIVGVHDMTAIRSTRNNPAVAVWVKRGSKDCCEEDVCDKSKKDIQEDSLLDSLKGPCDGTLGKKRLMSDNMGCFLAGLICIGVLLAFVFYNKTSPLCCTREGDRENATVDMARNENHVRSTRNNRELTGFAGFEFGESYSLFEDVVEVQKTSKSQENRIWRDVKGREIEGMEGFSDLYVWGSALSNRVFHIKLVTSEFDESQVVERMHNYARNLETKYGNKFEWEDDEATMTFKNHCLLWLYRRGGRIIVSAYDDDFRSKVMEGYEYVRECDLPSLETFLGVKFGDDCRKYNMHGDILNEDDGSYSVCAQMNEFMNFDTYKR